MPSLVLENDLDEFDLDYVLKRGRGVQVLSGVTGMGLPPKQVQWLEGAGDGAKARGRRVLPRDLDLPLLIEGRDRADLQNLLSRLARILADTATLRLVEDDGTDWSVNVEHVGGGDYVYGVDTIGEDEFYTVITLRAGDPFFTYSVPSRKTIGSGGAGRGLVGKMVSMQVASSQAIGSMQLENPGDAKAYGLWVVKGPGRDFKAISPRGETLHWEGVLPAERTLTFDTQAGTVFDDLGNNRYSELAPAPRFWSIPPGTTTAKVELQDIDSRAEISCTWRPRKWLVV